eukprot:6197842-Pleurochrysis_carterae.AAC.2
MRVQHWRRESGAWTRLRCVVLHGSRDARRALLRYALNHADLNGARTGHLRFNLMVTSYENFVCELASLSLVKWQYVVIDEAHRLKNPQSRLHAAVRGLESEHLTLLTGTPVQNSVAELVALMTLIDEAEFGGERGAEIVGSCENVTTYEQLRMLQQMLRPYMLRRTKAELDTPLPTKRETVLKVRPAQRITRI